MKFDRSQTLSIWIQTPLFPGTSRTALQSIPVPGTIISIQNLYSEQNEIDVQWIGATNIMGDEREGPLLLFPFYCIFESLKVSFFLVDSNEQVDISQVNKQIRVM